MDNKESPGTTMVPTVHPTVDTEKWIVRPEPTLGKY